MDRIDDHPLRPFPTVERPMTRCCLAASIVLAIAASPAPLPAAGKEKKNVDIPAHKKQFHVYLLLGQANMSGRGYAFKEDRVQDEKILSLSKEGEWIIAAEPLHYDKPVGMAGVGPGLSFARTIKRDVEEEVVIGVVPCAWDGSILSRWEKGGDLYGQCLLRARKAMAQGTLKGILWHHGETDASRYVQAVTYGDRLQKMVVDLRKDLGDENVPFLAGRLSILLPNNRFPAVKVVNDGIDTLPRTVRNTDVVGVEQLSLKPDGVSFDTAGARELGKRYAAAMVVLQKKSGLR